MEKHVEILKRFVQEKDPTKELDRLSKLDKDVALKWERAKSTHRKLEVKSHKDVEWLIDCFEKTVLDSPDDIRERNNCKYEMLIAQYEVMRGLKIWCNKLDTISIFITSEFPKLTQEEVTNIISRLEFLINHI